MTRISTEVIPQYALRIQAVLDTLPQAIRDLPAVLTVDPIGSDFIHEIGNTGTTDINGWSATGEAPVHLSLAIFDGSWEVYAALLPDSQLATFEGLRGASGESLRYTLAHELGHVFDLAHSRPLGTVECVDNPSTEERIASLMGFNLCQVDIPDGSIYSRQNSREAYGELFAEWVLSGGKTEVQSAHEWAHKYGWPKLGDA